VELGSWRATSACSFASGNPDGKVITIDIHREDKVAQQKCYEAVRAYPNLEYINGWTWDDWVVKKVRDINIPIDILFIDAWHRKDYVEKEWGLYVPMMADEGLIICDDLFNDPSVTAEMLEFWATVKYDKFENSGIHPGIPMGFAHYVKSN
jgi:predicted O-methyltransferase YrrM